MSATSDPLIHDTVNEVLARLYPSATQPSAASFGAASGLFANVDEAVAVASKSQRQLAAAGVRVRGEVTELIKTIAAENAVAWAEFELAETKMGRLDHKIAKLEVLASVPGVEFLKTIAHSGDHGVGLDEGAPWGVIGCVTPVTHSIPTLADNAINMIAAGNSAVFNPHPGGYRSAAMAAAIYNRLIKARYGLDPLLCVIDPPTIETAHALFDHPDVKLLVATGGPGVTRAALAQPKRAIVAGPGNPPVVVDVSADLDRAAQSIIAGGGFDNNLLCIGEKEVFVVEPVFDDMMVAMERAGAVRLDANQIAQLTEAAFERRDDRYAVNKGMIGKDAAVLAGAAGTSAPDGCYMLFGETTDDHPFVVEEQMMPFMPFVRVRDFEEGLAMAVKHEHGYRHTAIIHSNNLANITRMGQTMNTTIFVANGPCTAGLGLNGEGYFSYSIATPTGEGITNPMSFTRFRRGSMVDALRFI